MIGMGSLRGVSTQWPIKSMPASPPRPTRMREKPRRMSASADMYSYSVPTETADANDLPVRSAHSRKEGSEL
jgi:hypothetical protein